MGGLNKIKNLLIILQIILNVNQIACSCGDWESFKNEKCFKIVVDKTTDYGNAMSICREQQNASMLVIQSAEEQQYLEKFIFDTNKVFENVWIGLRRNVNGQFEWVDNNQLTYSYWDKDKPSNKSGYDCVEMQADSKFWTNFDCRKKNAVVCQRIPDMTIEELKKMVIKLQKTVKDNSEEIKKLKQNPVPIGFIYVQMPNQPEPKSLFPDTDWSDVSSQYAGYFFRIFGGSSAEFGQMQEDASPRITEIQSNCGDCPEGNKVTLFKENLNGNLSWTGQYYTGSWGSNLANKVDYRHKIRLSNSEVRPKNIAVKIWKRTK